MRILDSDEGELAAAAMSLEKIRLTPKETSPDNRMLVAVRR